MFNTFSHIISLSLADRNTHVIV